MNILVISSIPFSYSNRGIDILTSATVELDYKVDHLVYPCKINTNTEVKSVNSNINQIFTKKEYLSYYEKICWWLPEGITKALISISLKKLENFNFYKYDYIIIESGFPIFLIEIIPENIKIIYRQSDSVKHILSKNKYLWKLEEKVMNRAYSIIVINNLFEKLINKKDLDKVVRIANGFNCVDNTSNVFNPYNKNEINAVYMGYPRLDYKYIKHTLINNKNININIIGSGLTKLEIVKLKKYKNFKYLGILNSNDYLPYIKYAQVAIIPYKLTEKTKYWGLTSKYLIFMQYGLPIVSTKVGNLKEFRNIPVVFAEDYFDFSMKVRNSVYEVSKVNYNIDFNFYNYKSRIKEYKKYFESLEE